MGLPERTLTEDGLEMQFATNHIGHFLFTNSILPKLIKAAESNPKGATRIVNITSLSPTMGGMRWSDLNFEKVNKDLPKAEQPLYEFHKAWGSADPENKSYLPFEGYTQGKIANVLFGIGANKRLYEKYGILTLSAHPGIILTELDRDFDPSVVDTIEKMHDAGLYKRKTLKAGSATGLVAALDPKLGAFEAKNGKANWGSYLIDCQISDKATPLAESSEEAEKLWTVSEELVKEKFSW